MTTQILLSAADEAWEARIRDAFDGALNGDLRRAGELPADSPAAVQRLLAENPKVIALGTEVPAELALDVARAIDGERPDVCVVLLADSSPLLLEQALRAGVRDVVAPEAPLTEVRAAFERALDTASRRRSGLALDGSATGGESRVITVVSPKGGAGKTVIASNLAVGLARREPGDVVVVDGDVQFGDVANALRLSPDATVADAARSSLDATSLKATLAPHPSGLYALCAPETPAEADEVGAETFQRVLDLLRDQFPYVVVDTAAGLDELTLAAAERSTDLVFVCGTDVASVRALRKVLDAFDLLGLTAPRRWLVLNHADARTGLRAEDIESTVGLPVDLPVPSSREVPLSLNQGMPLLESDRRSGAARALEQLVERFGAPVGAPNPVGAKAGGLFRRRRDQ